VTIPSGAIQNLFDSVSPEDVNASLVKIRTNDGKWKTFRSTSIFDANIELTPRSQRIEIQLIVEGKDPITYEIVLDRVASSSSKSPNFAMSIALGFCVLLIAMYFLIFKRRRHDEK
jgi:lipoprotein signal peptidase